MLPIKSTHFVQEGKLLGFLTSHYYWPSSMASASFRFCDLDSSDSGLLDTESSSASRNDSTVNLSVTNKTTRFLKYWKK